MVLELRWNKFKIYLICFLCSSSVCNQLPSDNYLLKPRRILLPRGFEHWTLLVALLLTCACRITECKLRELPDMMSASERDEGGHGKADIVREVA